MIKVSNQNEKLKDNSLLNLNYHELFLQNYQELHTRPFPVLSAPVQLSTLVFQHHPKISRQDEIIHINKLCEDFTVEVVAREQRCFYQNFGDFELRWERHSEFSSYTFIIHGALATPFQSVAINSVPANWLAEITGKVIAATHIEMQSVEQLPVDREYLKEFFQHKRLIASELHSGDASLWSPLCLHKDNFNRILVINKSLNECQCGRVIRDLIELEIYRNMTLLALPLAQKVSAQVNDMEAQLAYLLQSKNQMVSLKSERLQLMELSEITACIAQLINHSRYRFDASHAYYQMVQSRLAELEERELNELQTMSSFVQRRLLPAHRTIWAVRNRLDDLAMQVDRASNFLRTRVDLSIETQNQALLRSMDKRAQIQVHLQQTVEGLSVVVVSYYILSLCRYLLVAINVFLFNYVIDVDKSLALLMPIVLFIVWLLSRRLKKRLHE